MLKKCITAIMVMTLLISFIACEEQAEEVNSTATPVESVTNETPKYSHTPEPTLTEEQRILIEKYDGLIKDCRRYNDWSAAVLIKDMYHEKEISEKDFFKLALIPGFKETRDMSDEVWNQLNDHINNISLIINGKQEDLDEAVLDKFYEDLCRASQQGSVYINTLDTQEKKDRIKRGILYINHWIDEPVDENFEHVKQMFFSDELSSGEIILLSCYMYHAEKSSEDRAVFLDSQDIKDYMEEAMLTLLNENSN